MKYAEHAVHIFQRELELDAATMYADSALTRPGNETWQGVKVVTAVVMIRPVT